MRSLLDLSLFRFAVEGVYYIDEGTSCSPSPNKIGANLRKILSEYPGESHELCGFGHQQMKDLARNIHKLSRRMILKVKPRLETLEVKVAGKMIPRDQIRWDSKSNEMEFVPCPAPTVPPVFGVIAHV